MKFTAFQMLLHRKFIIERYWPNAPAGSEKMTVEDVANKLGVDRSTMYSWIDGVRTCPVDMVPHIFLITRDPEFLEFCLHGTGYTLAPLPGANTDIRRIETETLEAVGAVGKLADAVRNLDGDAQTERARKAVIRGLVQIAHREIADVAVAADDACPATTPLLKAVK